MTFYCLAAQPDGHIMVWGFGSSQTSFLRLDAMMKQSSIPGKYLGRLGNLHYLDRLAVQNSLQSGFNVNFLTRRNRKCACHSQSKVLLGLVAF